MSTASLADYPSGADRPAACVASGYLLSGAFGRFGRSYTTRRELNDREQIMLAAQSWTDNAAVGR
jgi:hypothetical protein